ncbi:hypothetical protein AMECASPLE_039861, partial [Ameca splendens]
PPQLAPLDVEEQRLYSEPLPDGRAPHPISKGVPGHLMEEAHFSRLYPGSRSFGHDPKFMAIGAYLFLMSIIFSNTLDVLINSDPFFLSQCLKLITVCWFLFLHVDNHTLSVGLRSRELLTTGAEFQCSDV